MKYVSEKLMEMPIIAIIRGVEPEDVVEVGRVLIDAGITIIEVPLNSPNPFESIRRLSEAFPDCVTGAGTVLKVEDVRKVKDAGGTIIVSPNVDVDVIAETVALNMMSFPGFQSATEALAAVQAGAKYLKLFPANSVAIGHIKAIKAILPADCKILAVGGAGANNMGQWIDASADGFGIGSDLYKPGMAASDVRKNADKCIAAYQKTVRDKNA